MKVLIDPIKIDAWRWLITANGRLIKKIDAEVTAAGFIPVDWYDVVLELSRAPGRRLRMHELADAIVLSRSGLTRHLDKLEKAGLVRRERCPSDRRGWNAVLTDQGFETLRKSWPAYAAAIEKYFASQITLKEARNLTVTLKRLAEEST